MESSISREYTCDNCGLIFPRYKAVSTKNYEYQFFEDSLIWHLIHTPECNKANAQSWREARHTRYQQEYDEMMEMI